MPMNTRPHPGSGKKVVRTSRCSKSSQLPVKRVLAVGGRESKDRVEEIAVQANLGGSTLGISAENLYKVGNSFGRIGELVGNEGVQLAFKGGIGFSRRGAKRSCVGEGEHVAHVEIES